MAVYRLRLFGLKNYLYMKERTAACLKKLALQACPAALAQVLKLHI